MVRSLNSAWLASVVSSLILTIPVEVQAAFSLVVTHPEAANDYHSTPQSPGTYGLSHMGREIKVLRQYENRLYIGYGQDDGPNKPGTCTPFYVNPNTGAPWCGISLRYYDPATAKLSSSLGIFRSQELSTLEVMNGYLYGLAEDREGKYDYFRCTASNCIGGIIPDGSAHLYSATSLNGTIYMSGSDDIHGVIWKSADNGNNWQQTLRHSPADSEDDFTRIYNVGGPYNGEVYATPRDYYAGYYLPSKTYDGNSANNWISLDRTLVQYTPIYRSRPFAEKLVSQEGLELKEYDGSSLVHNYPHQILNFTIAGDWLYVLNTVSGNHDIMRTRDLVKWYKVDTAPSTALSIEVVLNRAYIGTTTGQIYKSDVDLSQEPTSVGWLPAVYLLLLLNE